MAGLPIYLDKWLTIRLYNGRILKTVRLPVKYVLCVFLGLILGLPISAAPANSPPNAKAAGSAHWSQLKPYIGQADGFGETPELIKLGPGNPVVAPTEDGEVKLIPVKYFHRNSKAKGNPSERDPVIQSSTPVRNTPSPTTSFEGIPNVDGFIPPDTVGAIGPSNYMQAVNTSVQVFSRSGAPQTGAALISSLFASLGPGSVCSSMDGGDVIVDYDEYADRWWISEIANVNSTTGPFYMSVAVSKTSDPTGAYYAYCFQIPNNLFPDYPKVGVWGDAYYMSVNEFNAAGTVFEGAGVLAFDRARMLAGDPNATFIYFNVGDIDLSVFSLQPSNADGPLPPIGTPNYFVYLRGVSLGDPSDDLRIFEFHADFANSNLSTFTERSESPVAVAAYTAFSPDSPGIPQSGTSAELDTLGDRLMFRLQYRNFGTNESLVVNHTVTGGSGQAAIRYYQLTRSLPGGTFGINEQATYAPDSLYRWMGSAAMNYQGDLAVGYSVSSSSTFPSIRYAARLNTDPPGGLFQGEATMITGSGAQTSSLSRWGDYSCMTIDPTDDSTFWYTQEYYATTSAAGWQTRIGSFALSNSAPAPRATIQGMVTRLGSGLALSNVVILTTNGYFRLTAANGTYSMNVTPGTYDLSAQLPVVGSNTVTGLILTNGQVLTQNFVLGSLVPQIETNSYSFTAGNCSNGAINPGEIVTLSLGLQNVGGADTSNLVVTLEPSNGVDYVVAPQTYGILSTDGTPVTQSFTFIAGGTCGGSISPVFQLQDGAINLGTITLNFPLGTLDTIFSENFDEVTAPALPAGWTTTASGAQSPWMTSTAASDTPPNSAFATDASNVGLNELISPAIAIPSTPAQLSFRNFYDTEPTYDGGVLEISINGGSFSDIISAGGSFVAGPYNGTLSTLYQNPLAGRAAWTGSSGGFITTIVNLPVAALGQTVQFKWRCGSDNSNSGPGWWVDTINITAVTCCPVPTTPLIDSLSLSNNQFQFSLLGTAGSNYVLLASTNLSTTNWVPLATNPAPFSFMETNVSEFPQRFYRGLVAP